MVLLSAVGGFVLAWLGTAWCFMLTVIVMHNKWWDFIPMVDFKTALAISFFPILFKLVFAFLAKLVEAVNE